MWKSTPEVFAKYGYDAAGNNPWNLSPVYFEGPGKNQTLYTIPQYGEMIKTYKHGGFDRTQYRKCQTYAGKIAGELILPFILRKHLRNEKFKDAMNISVRKVYRHYFWTSSFHWAIFRSIISATRNRLSP